jgi:hypothetical protein
MDFDSLRLPPQNICGVCDQKHKRKSEIKIFLDFLKKYEEDLFVSLSAYLKCGFAHNVDREREGRIATGQIIPRNKILTIKMSLVFWPMKDYVIGKRQAKSHGKKRRVPWSKKEKKRNIGQVLHGLKIITDNR